MKILIVVTLCLFSPMLARASSYFGQINFGGLPLPGLRSRLPRATKPSALRPMKAESFTSKTFPTGNGRLKSGCCVSKRSPPT